VVVGVTAAEDELDVNPALVDVNWARAVDTAELRFADAIVFVTGVVGVGVGAASGVEEAVEVLVCVGVFPCAGPVVDEDDSEPDPPPVMLVIANAGLELPESPKRTMI